MADLANCLVVFLLFGEANVLKGIQRESHHWGDLKTDTDLIVLRVSLFSLFSA